ncbi:hypothetical protein HGRIS_004078 [Hohenbuehelia grisea]|uniref:2'-phosphotransferase n=1 Tax=Hohenbuehelia grisea TaxID=104357 RepID=A0ABR3JI77_9AGAR
MQRNQDQAFDRGEKPARNQAQQQARKQSQKPGSSKLRGLPKDNPEVKLSKTLSWILRHEAKSEGLVMRPDGYVKVDDLLSNARLQDLDLEKLKSMVEKDAKTRFNLTCETVDGTSTWLIRANQGHTLKTVQVELTPIESVADIPTRVAVHGTNLKAWESISKQGLSKMKRNHIHLAQGVAGENVISGMRSSSQVLIFVDVQKALDAGVKFHLSANGVVLTEGDDRGFLLPEFFRRVENAKREALPGWEGPVESTNTNEPTIPISSAES